MALNVTWNSQQLHSPIVLTNFISSGDLNGMQTTSSIKFADSLTVYHHRNDFEDPELGFSDRAHSEGAPLSHNSPYNHKNSQKAVALQLQDRPDRYGLAPSPLCPAHQHQTILML